MSTNTDKTYLPETARKWAIATHLGELRRGLERVEVEVPLMEAWLRARTGKRTGTVPTARHPAHKPLGAFQEPGQR